MSETFDYDLICIGSGPAGQRAAVQAAKLNKRVAVIEKRRVIGGVCLETGTIPSKTFREAVRTFNVRAGFDDGLGFAPKVKPTMTQLLGRVNDVIRRETRVQTEQLQKNDINIIRATATFTGPHSIQIDNEEGSRVLTSEHFLIATGSMPAKPRGVAPDGKTLIDSDGILDLKDLPQTMAVVGAGVIGIEYATMFANLGVDVIVIDKRTRPMEFLDHELTDELMYQMRQIDVTFRLGEAVDRIDITDDTDGNPMGVIYLESGKAIAADLVLFSAGRQGATASLGLDAAGLSADERGRIDVNQFYQSSAKHIYAAGDVIGFPALAATSAEQGRRAACHMFGADCETLDALFPIGIYSIPEISTVGQTEEELTDKRIPYECGIARYNEIARGQILGDSTGLVKMIFHRETGNLLGVHAIGTGATELIHVGQAVIALGGGLDYFTQTVFNYPTFAECFKVAALNAANKLKRLKFSAPLPENDPPEEKPAKSKKKSVAASF